MRRSRILTQKKILRIIKHLYTRVGKSRRFRYTRLVIIQRFSTLLIVGGLIILLLPMIQKSLMQPEYAAINELETSGSTFDFGPIQIAEGLTQGKNITQPPMRIIIPTLSIDLPVTESRVVDGYWEVSEMTASHGMGSSLPGQNGNIVIFAHARKGLFLPLRGIRANDRIYVLTNDRWYRYRTENIREVAPTDVAVIRPTADETLTLFTCSGFLDSKRLVVVAKPDR